MHIAVFVLPLTGHKTVPIYFSAYELYVDSDSDKTAAVPVGSNLNTQLPQPATSTSARQPHERPSLMSRLKKAFPAVFGPANSEQAAPHDQNNTKRGGQDSVSMAERFKRAFSRKDVRVHFVGAWYVISSASFKAVILTTTLGIRFLP
jgi:hypothetical protein